MKNVFLRALALVFAMVSLQVPVTSAQELAAEQVASDVLTDAVSLNVVDRWRAAPFVVTPDTRPSPPRYP